MDIELKGRIESKQILSVYQYLKEAYCKGAESMHNVISLSRRTSFILSLKKLLDTLCGPDDATAMLATSLLVQYSGCFSVFNKQLKTESRHSHMPIYQKKEESTQLVDLILYVWGTFPSDKFHLFPILLEETRNITIPISTAVFPIVPFKEFLDIVSKQTTQSLPSTISPLYSKYLIHYGSPKNNQYDIHPFDYFILRYLHCMSHLNVANVYEKDFFVVLQSPTQNTSSILAINLFLHYLNYLIKPAQPSKPNTFSVSSIPSISQPDFFLIHAVCELWLNADNRIMNDWYLLYSQSGHQAYKLVNQPTKAMVACLTELVKHLAHAPQLATEGISAFDSELSYNLFYFFAKQFAHYNVQNLKKYHASFSELVHCWAMYLQPWLFTGKTASDYTAFIQRHYFFYQGLLVLIIKRLSIFPVNSTAIQQTIIQTLVILERLFTPQVMSVLNACDGELQSLQKTFTSLDHSGLYKQDYLTEGLHMLKLSKITIVSVSAMIDQETMHCLLTKICRSFISFNKEFNHVEMKVISFLAQLFAYRSEQFSEYYTSLKKDFQPVDEEVSWYYELIQPIKSFLFSTVATQQHRTLPRLTDPITQFESAVLVHLFVWLTVWVNKCLFIFLHCLDQSYKGMNWSAYFDDPNNCYVNLRWFADRRNLFWLFIFIGFCKIIYWIGMLF